ncbi:MAG: class I SAM-dependent methyltransferase [Cyclobacteriaceae bacterium]|nr:class I SAM-dependent methyltransferase [Cyclobacteriaceae bacterium]
MAFNRILELIPLYTGHFLLKSDAHGIQSPFVFEFYTEVVQWRNKVSDPLKDLVNELRQNREKINAGGFGASSHNLIKPTTIADIAGRAISPFKISYLLARIARYFKIETIAELGTSLGINALRLSELLPNARIVSFEGNTELISFASKLLDRYEARNVTIIEGNIDATLPEYLRCGNSPELIYIDANHTSEALLRYTRSFLEYSDREMILVIDDIRWSKDMYQGWRNMVQMKEVGISLDLGRIGIVFVRPYINKEHHILNF